MGGLAVTQRIVLLDRLDEHLAALVQLREEAARIAYRLNAVAPDAEPVARSEFRFSGMEAAFQALTEAAENRWEQINNGGRLQDPDLWTPDRAT